MADTYTIQFISSAVRKNRYVILPADFEEAWKQTVKRTDETLEFCKSAMTRGSVFTALLTLWGHLAVYRSIIVALKGSHTLPHFCKGMIHASHWWSQKRLAVAVTKSEGFSLPICQTMGLLGVFFLLRATDLKGAEPSGPLH